MKRIAVIVINSVNHDSRVLKEADSLASVGYDVTVFGIQDSRCSEPQTFRNTGVRIVRCNLRAATLRACAHAILLTGFLTTVTLLSAYFVLSSFVAISMKTLGALGLMAVFIPFYSTYLHYREQASRLSLSQPPTTASWLLSTGRVMRRLMATVRWFLGQAVNRIVTQREMSKVVAQFEPDVVHCHDLPALPVGYACKKKIGCPIVFDSHELFEELSMSTGIQKWIAKLQQRYYSGKVDGFITVNDSIADYLRIRYPRLPPPFIIKNAVKLPRERIEYDGRLHDATGLARQTQILLYQGGFARYRGLDPLVRASWLLPAGWCVVMMGWGKMEAELREIAATLDPAGERVRFVPPVPQGELLHSTAGATLGIIPYENVCLNHWFSTPNKLWEYAAAGVPILASPFPELRRMVEGSRIGKLIATPPTPENIAEIVASVNETELAAMRTNCRSLIARDNWAVYEHRLFRLYDVLLHNESDGRSVAPQIEVLRMGPVTATTKAAPAPSLKE